MPFGVDIDFENCAKEIATMLADFGFTYMKAYQCSLAKKILDESFEKKGGEEAAARQLKQIPAPTAPEMKGEMKTKSAILGRWKKRYFFIKENYELGYTSAAEGKEEGCYNLWGYKVQSLQHKPEGPRKGGPDWIPDEERPNCKTCNKQFTNLIWHHHCRNCGEVFCGDCSGNKAQLNHFGYEKPQRVCDACFAQLGRNRSGTFAVVQPTEEKVDAEFHGIFLLHKTRTPYILECESLAVKKQWMDALIECCKRSQIPLNPNPVLAAAFEDAHKSTMQSMGYMEAWRVTGTESEMLGDLFARSIDQKIVQPAFDQAGVIPPNIKRMASSAISGQVAKLVRAAVEPGWRALMKKIDESQTTISDKVRPLLQPVAQARQKVVDTLKANVARISAPAIDKAGNVVINVVMEKAASPILEAYAAMFSALNQVVMGNLGKISNKSSVDEFVHNETREFRGSHGHLKPVYMKIDEITKTLKESQEGVEGLKYFPVSKTFNAVIDSLHNLVNQALYTMQHDESLANADPEKFKAAWVSTRAKLLHDSRLDVMDLITKTLQETAMGPIQEHVLQSSELQGILGPIDDLIPEAVRDYISVSGTVNDILTGIVEDAVARMVNASSAKTIDSLENSMRTLAI